MVTIGL
jgi:hypothetical protein